MKSILIVTCIFCLSISHILAQDNLKFQLKDAPQSDIYIDGKKYDHEIFDLLDQSKIESISVLKGEQALKEYDAPNGVIIIKTKKASQQMVKVDKEEMVDDTSNNDPIFIIDGKVSSKERLDKLSPDDIESIEVLKGQKAIDQYNTPNGVIIIKTKK